MNEDPRVSVFRIWAAVAWADNKISKEELSQYKRLLDQADLGDNERKTALGYLHDRPELDLSNLSLGDKSPEEVYQIAARMAAIDEEVLVQELVLLARLRDALQIDESRARTLEAAIEAE